MWTTLTNPSPVAQYKQPHFGKGSNLNPLPSRASDTDNDKFYSHEAGRNSKGQIKAARICNKYNISAELVSLDALIEGSSRAKKFGKLAGSVYGVGLPLAFIIPRKRRKQELLAQQVKPGELYYPVLVHFCNSEQAEEFTRKMLQLADVELHQADNGVSQGTPVSRKRDVFKNLLSPHAENQAELNWFKLAKGNNYDIPLWAGGKDVLVLRTADKELALDAFNRSEQYIIGLN